MALERSTLTAALLALAGAALAEGDGAVGPESQATAVISFTKENAVRISGVGDADFGSRSSLAVSERFTEGLCVYSSTGAYAVTVTSANGAFVLSGEDTLDTIPYAVQWISGLTNDLAYATELGGQIGHATRLDCDGNDNAQYRVIVTPNDFNAVAPGVYRDTLTVQVRPE